MIKRDGTCVSLWQDKITAYDNENSNKKIFDIAIVGGGISGITTALLLQKAGKSCVVLEAHNLGFGTTGGTTAHLNTLLDTPYTTIIKNFGKEKARQVAQAASDALILIQQNIKEYVIDCGYAEAQAYLFSQNNKESDELNQIHDASLEVGLHVRFTDQLPIPIPYEKILLAENQGKFHPLKYVFTLADAFRNAGGIIKENCQVDKVDEEKERIHIETSNGTYETGKIIYATHIPPGINILHLKCLPYRSYAMAVRLTTDSYPQGLFYDMKDPYHYYRTQNIDGTDYFIVGGYDHKTGHEDNTEKSFRELESHIRGNFDVKEITHQWSSQYYESVDGLPFIGHLPGHGENVFVATGYGGNGMTYSHVAAIALTSLITTGESLYGNLFSPARIKPVAGFSNFVNHNADVIKEFIGKWFAVDELEQFSEMAPDEGKVIKYDGKSIALYKDTMGTLHAVSAVCRHMGCSVAWNSAEKSWDCPCHGARYSCDGKMLNGPAASDLEKIELRNLISHNE